MLKSNWAARPRFESGFKSPWNVVTCKPKYSSDFSYLNKYMQCSETNYLWKNNFQIFFCWVMVDFVLKILRKFATINDHNSAKNLVLLRFCSWPDQNVFQKNLRKYKKLSFRDKNSTSYFFIKKIFQNWSKINWEIC